jgi:L-glyceraldehyde 3-phosphate reductase
VTSALIGASRWSQIEDALGALDNLEFSSDELAQIDRHAVEGDINIWAASSDAG